MAKALTEKLHNLKLTDLLSDVEAFVSSGPELAALQPLIQLAAYQLQARAGQLSAEQRATLLQAALTCYSAVQSLPDDAAAKFADRVYFFAYTCAGKDEFELALSFACELTRLLPAAAAVTAPCPAAANLSQLLRSAGYRCSVPALCGRLLLASLRLLLRAGAAADRVAQVALGVAQWARRCPEAPGAAFGDGVLALAAEAPEALRPRLALAGVSVAFSAGRPPPGLRGTLGRLLPGPAPPPPPITLVTELAAAAAGDQEAVRPAAAALTQLDLEDDLTADALYTVFTILSQLASSTGSRKHKVSAELASLACDAARRLVTCRLPARVPAEAAGRACNAAHTLLVETVRGRTAPPALLTAGIAMLKSMPALADRLAPEDAAWWAPILVTVSGNLGVVSSQASQPADAAVALSIYFDAVAAAQPGLVKSSSVADKAQLLVDIYRRQAEYGAALRVLARAVPFARDHHPQLATLWAKTKRDAHRRKQTDCLLETMPHVMTEVGSGQHGTLLDADAVRLLRLEIKHYLTVSRDLVAPVRAALDQLRDLDLTPADRAWYLVTRARAGVSGPDEAARDCAQAVAILAEAIGDNKESPLRLDLCIANYELCISRKRVEMEASKLSPLTRLVQKPAQPDNEVDLDASCTVVPDYLSINLDREAATLQPLQAAMALAETLLSKELPESAAEDAGSALLAVVTGAARVYAGLGYQLQAAAAWRLAYRAARSRAASDAMVNAASELLQLDLWPESEDLAAVSAAAAASEDKLVPLRWTVAQAWRLYHQQQIGAAFQLLDPVLEDPLLLCRTSASFSVASGAHRLASLCARVPPATAARNATELAELALFYSSCVKSWEAADRSACLAEHLAALGLHFDTVRHMGSLLLTLHCPRELRSYVRDEVDTAHRLAAALRTAEFLSLLVEADLLCEEADDSQIKLRSLRYIVLDVPAEREKAAARARPAAAAPVRVCRPAAARRRPSPSSGRRSPAPVPAGAGGGPGAEPPERGRDVPPPSAALGSPLGRDARWLQRQPRCTSPALRRAQFAAPGPVSHPAACRCAACACPRRLLLTFSLGVQTARAAVLADDDQQATEFAAGADNVYPLIEEKMRRAVVSLLGDVRGSQLDGRLEAARVARCRGRLALADTHSWFGRPRAARDANAAALRMLQELSSGEQLVSRHLYLLTEIWNQRLAIDSLIAEEEEDQLDIGTGAGDIGTGAGDGPPRWTLTVDPPPDADEVSPGRRTPTLSAPPPPAKPPRRPAKRAGRTRPATPGTPATPPSPPLVRSTRRRAAAVKTEIQACPPARREEERPAPRATRSRRKV